MPDMISNPPMDRTLPAYLDLPRNASRVLLIHPPIYDIRIPWVRYVQPIRLLRLSTFFRNADADVRFIDAVALTEAFRSRLAAGLNIKKPVGILEDLLAQP